MNSKKAYWWCQLCGWGTYILIYTFFYLTISSSSQANFFQILFLDAFLGLCLTHIMRLVILKSNVLEKSIRHQIIFILLITLLFAIAYSSVSVWLEREFNITNAEMRKYSFVNQVSRGTIGSFLFLAIWNLIYFAYHFVTKSQQAQTDRLQLQSVVKELELKTIKAHINPHFIFNALNSIRALVDINPERARSAITQLSNILRSSMHADKQETSSLENELSIVKDYLALEHIRFEERLQVVYNIQDETLDYQIPQMMLQTLVENAIKHGISRQVKGGVVKIVSRINNGFHELIIDNTGKLNEAPNPLGFGVSSTHERLKILYGAKAAFDLSEQGENVVAKVSIPVN